MTPNVYTVITLYSTTVKDKSLNLEPHITLENTTKTKLPLKQLKVKLRKTAKLKRWNAAEILIKRSMCKQQMVIFLPPGDCTAKFQRIQQGTH